MQILYFNAAALMIAAMYYLWRDGYAARVNRERVLRERVAYMLWVCANHAA